MTDNNPTPPAAASDDLHAIHIALRSVPMADQDDIWHAAQDAMSRLRERTQSAQQGGGEELWKFVERAYDAAKTSRAERLLDDLGLPVSDVDMPLSWHINRAALAAQPAPGVGEEVPANWNNLFTPGRFTNEEAAEAFAGLISTRPAESVAQGGEDDWERQWREGWAYSYSGWKLYGDDGELQDNSVHPFIDWRKDSPGEIRRKIAQRSKAKAIDTHAATYGELPPIERDEEKNRDYIPLPGGWEIQTKGNGSTFRLQGPKDGDHMPITDRYVPEMLVRMAHDIRAAWPPPATGSGGEA